MNNWTSNEIFKKCLKEIFWWTSVRNILLNFCCHGRCLNILSSRGQCDGRSSTYIHNSADNSGARLKFHPWISTLHAVIITLRVCGWAYGWSRIKGFSQLATHSHTGLPGLPVCFASHLIRPDGVLFTLPVLEIWNWRIHTNGQSLFGGPKIWSHTPICIPSSLPGKDWF